MALGVFLFDAAPGPAEVLRLEMGVGQAWAWSVSQMLFRWERLWHRTGGLPAQQLMGLELGTARTASPLEEIPERNLISPLQCLLTSLTFVVVIS